MIHDSETPAKGKQVITACAFIYQEFDGTIKVFLPKRATTKKFLPSVYELPGGHIDFGEHIEDGLRREIDEEFGMSILVGQPYYVFDYTNPVKGSHSVEIIYLAQFTDDLSGIALNPEDHSTFGWFSEDGLIEAYTADKPADDPEMQAIRAGFMHVRKLA